MKEMVRPSRASPSFFPSERLLSPSSFLIGRTNMTDVEFSGVSPGLFFPLPCRRDRIGTDNAALFLPNFPPLFLPSLALAQQRRMLRGSLSLSFLFLFSFFCPQRWPPALPTAEQTFTRRRTLLLPPFEAFFPSSSSLPARSGPYRER